MHEHVTGRGSHAAATRRRVAVIGAGAAGSMAAIFAASAARRRCSSSAPRDGGRKILISGGGRCNVLPMRVDERALRHRLVAELPPQDPPLVAARRADRLLRARAGDAAGRGSGDREALPGLEPRARRARRLAGPRRAAGRAVSAEHARHRSAPERERLAGERGRRRADRGGRRHHGDRRALGAEHRQRRDRARDPRGASATRCTRPTPR